MTSLVMLCRPRSFSLFGCNRTLSNQPSGMFSLVCHSGIGDFCFWLSIFSSVSLKLDNNIHFPADFLLCFAPFCLCYFFLSFFSSTQLAVHSSKNIYLICQMFFRWSQRFLFTDPYFYLKKETLFLMLRCFFFFLLMLIVLVNCNLRKKSNVNYKIVPPKTTI